METYGEYTTERKKSMDKQELMQEQQDTIGKIKAILQKQTQAGIQYRGFAGDGTVSNEGGFRVILYLG